MKKANQFDQEFITKRKAYIKSLCEMTEQITDNDYPMEFLQKAKEDFTHYKDYLVVHKQDNYEKTKIGFNWGRGKNGGIDLQFDNREECRKILKNEADPSILFGEETHLTQVIQEISETLKEFETRPHNLHFTQTMDLE